SDLPILHIFRMNELDLVNQVQFFQEDAAHQAIEITAGYQAELHCGHRLLRNECELACTARTLNISLVSPTTDRTKARPGTDNFGAGINSREAMSAGRRSRASTEDHSGLRPANLTTLDHLPVSSATNVANSAGVIGMGSPPSSAMRVFILGSAKAARTTWLI